MQVISSAFTPECTPRFIGEGDLDAARALVSSVETAELFLYQGRGHVFADNSLSSYDDAAARLLTQRVIRFLQSIRFEL